MFKLVDRKGTFAYIYIERDGRDLIINRTILENNEVNPIPLAFIL